MRTHYCFGRRREGELSRDDLLALIAEGRTRQAALAALPVERLVGLLERVGQAWADPDFAYRRRVLDESPAAIGFSREMVEQELLGLTMALSRPYLETKIASELGRLDALDTWHRRAPSAVFQKARPRGVVLHVASGNVSTAGVLSMIEGLLARNVNFLKVASNAPLLPLLFAESLRELDDTGVVGEAFCVLSWSGERTPHHEVFQAEADAIVVWGGEEVVHVYRQGLSLGCKLIEYGPKVSLGLFGAERLSGGHLEPLAAQAARDVSMWDQSACSSPQVLYLEDASPAHETTRRFVTALARELDTLATRLPMGDLTIHERAEITKERELALADELMGHGTLVVPDNQSWTIVVDRRPEFRLSPLFRTILVKPVETLEAALPHLAPYRAYLQSVALAVGPARAGELAERLFALGAQRVTRPGEMSGGFPGEPHDGRFGLGELVQWVSLDTPEAADAFDGAIFLSATQERERAWAKRKLLVESTLAHSPFYRAHFGTVRLQSEADWEALPLMGKAEVLAHTPPVGTGLFTREPRGGHWLRSGGSSGDPKLSIFTYADYEDDMWASARGAHAAGLRKGERVANLFFAGDLYGSFLSLNRVLELLECNSFPFTNHASIESVLHCLREFRIETVIGLSSWVQEVLGAAMRAPEGIRVRHVLYAGEHFSEQAQRTLREGLGVERVTSIGYGSVDAGPMGFQCACCEGSAHHVHADHVHLEVVDPATGRAVPEGEVGEIVVSNLNRRLMPLVRYRIGDLGRMLPGPCPCGRTSPRFELLGRAEEALRVGSARIHYGDVQRVVERHAALSANPQVRLTDGACALTVRAELADPQADARAVEGALREGLAANLPALAALEWRVEVVPLGTLERVGGSGKIVRVVDQRA